LELEIRQLCLNQAYASWACVGAVGDMVSTKVPRADYATSTCPFSWMAAVYNTAGAKHGVRRRGRNRVKNGIAINPIARRKTETRSFPINFPFCTPLCLLHRHSLVQSIREAPESARDHSSSAIGVLCGP